ncbi:MAG: DUF11 domain-containing protein, partial [Armatimonadota bacterium]|nr:DUF11 domain-containing protein [Armatimonadota bacterium]
MQVLPSVNKYRLCLLLSCLMLAIGLAPARAAYVNRFSTTTNGAMTFTGNTLGLSKNADQNRPGTEGSIGAFLTLDNTKRVSNQWPTPPPGTTLLWQENSSAAQLVVPSGSTVLYAELIWGGSYNFGGQDVSAFLNNAVSFTTPFGTSSVTPDAATRQITAAPDNYYVRSANVTALVQAAGAGTYSVGGVPATVAPLENNANAAGWTLAVVYRNATLPVRNMTIFVGAELTGTGVTPSPSQVSGFCTPAAGTVNARVLVSAIEGDANFSGDQLRFGPSTTSLTPLSGPNNPVNNFFGSQINNDAGNLNTTGTAGTLNHSATTVTNVSGARQGWDITNVSASGILPNNQTTAFAQGSSTQDRYTITTLGIQIDVGAPIFTPSKTVDKTTTFIGDVLTYTVNVNNTTGSAEALNVVFKDVPPTGTSFVAGSFSVDGVAQPAANPANGVNLGTVAQGTNKVVQFQVRVDSIPPSAQYTNTASWTYNAPCATLSVQASTTNAVTTGIVSLAPTKTASPAGAVVAGQTITYTIAVPNNGTLNSAGTTLTEPIPAGTTYVAGSTTLNGTAVADVAGAMPYAAARTINSPGEPAGQVNAGETATVVFTVTVNNPPPDSVSNTATIDPDGGGPSPPQTITSTNTVARLAPTKTANPSGTIIAGQT